MVAHNMILAKTVNIDDDVADDFSDGNEIPFGEKLFYRLVAFRTILNETDQDEDILSEPSDIITAIPVDNRNPQAPEISACYSGTLTSLDNVSFQWNKTAYNGTYFLYKMNAMGNWSDFIIFYIFF